MKRSILLFIAFAVVVLIGSLVFFKGLVIANPTLGETEVKEIVVVKIAEGGVKDIVFKEENGNTYYINRGLEQDMTLTEMENNVLNKKVTLHLAKTIMGTSNHISQLTVDGKVLFTEIK